MSDHENGINSICRHPKGDVLADTVSTSIIVLEDGEVMDKHRIPAESLRYASI